MDYPRCTSEAGVIKHVAVWEQLLSKYGSELWQTPEMLRILILGIVPKHIEEKLTAKHLKYPTHQTIIQYCRERYEVSGQQEISVGSTARPSVATSIILARLRDLSSHKERALLRRQLQPWRIFTT